jgi:hypothetical protein
MAGTGKTLGSPWPPLDHERITSLDSNESRFRRFRRCGKTPNLNNSRPLTHSAPLHLSLAVCKKFMQDPMEVYVDDEAKLTLHGLKQHYCKLKDNEKNRKLFELLDVLEFNQVGI